MLSGQNGRGQNFGILRMRQIIEKGQNKAGASKDEIVLLIFCDMFGFDGLNESLGVLGEFGKIEVAGAHGIVLRRR